MTLNEKRQAKKIENLEKELEKLKQSFLENKAESRQNLEKVRRENKSLSGKLSTSGRKLKEAQLESKKKVFRAS